MKMVKRNRWMSALVLLTLMILPVQAQILDPVSWSFESRELENGNVLLEFKAAIDDTWHMYGMDLPDGGPIPTTFEFEASEKYERIGKVVEVTEAEIVYDASFLMDIPMFSHEALFSQEIKLLTDEPFTLEGFVNFMCCDDERCLPPKDVDFSIQIGEAPVMTAAESVETNAPQSESLLGFFLLSMLAGLLGIITPCVFPMIPMTVAFFSQGGGSKGQAVLKALVFGISIMLIYTLVGLIVSLTSAGADLANTLSTHWIPNSLFFLLFIIFAASFFGAFEMVMPNRWVSKADSKVDKGGVIAAFFLGVTTVLVSFSCTGPIVGALLVEAASGDVVKPTLGMFGFGLAFAIPFTLFAFFPSWLNKLPKSGGWLNSIKVVLGFVMVAFGMKFIVNIDQTYHLNLISRDFFLAIWIVLFLLLGMYLLGKIKFSHDSDLKHIGVFRLLLVIASFSFAVYLIPGLFGAPLPAISGLTPPMEAQQFKLEGPVSGGVAILTNDDRNEICEEPKYADFLHLPHGLEGYFDYEQGMACARKLNKPVFLDFKGHACANCKEMEAKVWSDPQVLKLLREEFVIIALYVDDRTRLPEEEWVTSGYDNKVKKTIGKKNADFQISRFQTNSQPYYVIVDHEGNPLNTPMGHDLNIQRFVDFLKEGIANF